MAVSKLMVGFSQAENRIYGGWAVHVEGHTFCFGPNKADVTEQVLASVIEMVGVGNTLKVKESAEHHYRITVARVCTNAATPEGSIHG
jgi:hypothetical protein